MEIPRQGLGPQKPDTPVRAGLSLKGQGEGEEEGGRKWRRKRGRTEEDERQMAHGSRALAALVADPRGP